MNVGLEPRSACLWEPAYKPLEMKLHASVLDLHSLTTMSCVPKQNNLGSALQERSRRIRRVGKLELVSANATGHLGFSMCPEFVSWRPGCYWDGANDVERRNTESRLAVVVHDGVGSGELKTFWTVIIARDINIWHQQEQNPWIKQTIRRLRRPDKWLAPSHPALPSVSLVCRRSSLL